MANNADIIPLGTYEGSEYAYNKSSNEIWIKDFSKKYVPTVGIRGRNKVRTFFDAKIKEITSAGSSSSNSGGSGSSEGSSNETIKLFVGTPRKQSSTLRYPKNIQDSNTDYVLFSFYKYAPPFGSAPGVQEPDANLRSGGRPGYKNYSSSNDRSYNSPSGLSSIILYMPEDIQAQFGAGWNGAGFGAAAAGVLNVAGVAGGGQDFGSKIQSMLTSGLGGGKAATFGVIVEAINTALGASLTQNQAIGGVTGTIINPNVELMYEAPKLRAFSLKFKLVPKSPGEAKDIRRICNTFKKSMLPTFGGQVFFNAGDAPNLITIPNLCQVHFMKGGDFHPYLPKYKLCGITDVSINYTPDGAYATVGQDGSPVATELTISFMESKLIFADEVKDDEAGGGI